jgi:hypothetical protein
MGIAQATPPDDALESISKLSCGTCGCLPLIEDIFHSTQEFRRKKRLLQNGCADLDQFTQFGKFVSKASDKQELHLGVSRTNLLRELKAVEPGHDNITHHKVDCAIVLLAQAERISAVGGRKDGEPDCFERPLQKASKVVVVFDYQDGDGTLGGRCEVKSRVR